MLHEKKVTLPEANSKPLQKTKKPYQKPDFLYLAPLEAMANICVGLPGQKGQTCPVSGPCNPGVLTS